MENNIKVTDTSVQTAEETKVSTGEVATPTDGAGADSKASVSTGTNTANLNDNSVSVPDGNMAKEETADHTKSDKRAEFEKLIKGEYKEFYEERIKDNLARRFRENSAVKRRNTENSEIVEMLFDKYNVNSGDLSALKSAIESDDAYLVAEAHKRGMGIEDYKYIKRLENENRRFHMMQSRYEADKKANEAVEKWYAESQQLKEVYPEFNIFEESRNKSFVSLIKSGVDVRTAYEVVHHNEIVSGIAENAAKEAERKTAEAIRTRAMRPAENGLSSSGSIIIKNDVSKLSPRERAEIARRVSRGERITF